MTPKVYKCGPLAVAIAGSIAIASQARAEYISIDDTASNNLEIGAGGFLVDALKVNGIALTDNSYDTHYTGEAKGKSVSFSGSFVNFAPVASQTTTTYVFVPPNALNHVFAELTLTQTPIDSISETLSGLFLGFGARGLPSTIPTGATVEVTNFDTPYSIDDIGISGIARLGLFVGLDRSSTTAQAIPEPASIVVTAIAAAGLLGAASIRRRRSTARA